jgi:hypothetical protein
MALTAKSGDEITSELTDIYEALLQEATGKPVRVYRSNNNKAYLVFRALAEGFKTLLDAVIALRGRFNPELCDEADLYGAAKLTGTEMRKGSGSVLQITVTNEGETEQRVLPQGEYRYMSASGMVFTFNCAGDMLLDPGGQKSVLAVSGSIGSYHVGDIADMAVSRVDGGPVDPLLHFSCPDNSGLLGYPDEDLFTFRQRILHDAERQDAVKETELKIRNLPGILECSLVFNQNNHETVYDGLTLKPMELLIVITGAPDSAIAEIVASNVIYQTHAVSPEQVVYYENDCYIGGRFPVYFMFHGKADFSLEITYRYDSRYQQPLQIENDVRSALAALKNMSTYVEIINEEAVYSRLSNLNIGSLRILNIDILVEGESVPYFETPKTRLPNLTGILFTAHDTGGVP